MRYSIQEKRTLTPEKLMGILEKKGKKITLKEAEKVLEMLYFLTKLIVEHKLKA